jgi:hypothetical protein
MDDQKEMQLWIRRPVPPPPLPPSTAVPSEPPSPLAMDIEIEKEKEKNEPQGISMAYADEVNAPAALLPHAASEHHPDGCWRKWGKKWSTGNPAISALWINRTNKFMAVATALIVTLLCVNISSLENAAVVPSHHTFAREMTTGVVWHEVQGVAFLRNYVLEIILYAVHAIYHSVALLCGNYLYFEALVQRTHYMRALHDLFTSIVFIYGTLLVLGTADVDFLVMISILQTAGLALILAAERRAFRTATPIEGHSSSTSDATSMVISRRLDGITMGLSENIAMTLWVTSVVFTIRNAFVTHANAAESMMVAVVTFDMLHRIFIAVLAPRVMKWSAEKCELVSICWFHALTAVYCLALEQSN